MKLHTPVSRMLAALPAALLIALPAQAQVGSGWTVYTPTERFEYESNDVFFTISPPPSSFNNGYCSFTRSGNVDTCKLLSSHSNRAEVRPNDDYSTGSHQFQAQVFFSAPSTGECIHQIFNGPTGPYLLLRESTNHNGDLTVGGTLPSGDKGGIVASNLLGTWFQLNSINDMNSGMTYLYINGKLVWQGANPGGTFYTKYGAYGSHDSAHPADITFSNVVLYTGGTTNGAGGSIDTSAVYQIENEASGLVLNNQGSTTNGSKITQWSGSSTSTNLRWTFIATSGGYYQINSVKSGLDAVVQSASTAQGAGIIQWSFGSSGDDQWKPVFNSDGSCTLYNLHSGLVLEDPGSSTSTSTQMDQWGANGGANQNWMLLKQ